MKPITHTRRPLTPSDVADLIEIAIRGECERPSHIYNVFPWDCSEINVQRLTDDLNDMIEKRVPK